MKRVAIIGSPGASKSTIARQLGTITGLPVTHLDKFFHEPDHDFINNKEAWAEETKKFARRPEWIIDGNYGATLKERCERADTVIYLEYPRPLIYWHLIKRRAAYHSDHRPDMPSHWRERIDWYFWIYVWKFKKQHRNDTRQIISELENTNVYYFTKRKQVKKFLANLA